MGAGIKGYLAEWEALQGEPYHVRIIYDAIRIKMDFSSGIAGLKDGLKISENYLRDTLRVNPTKGRHHQYIAVPLTRQTIRSAIERLEKMGLIKHRGNYVFECLLATSDKSVQNINNQMRPYQQPNEQPYEQPIETYGKSLNKNNKLFKNTLSETMAATISAPDEAHMSNPQPEPEPEYPEFIESYEKNITLVEISKSKISTIALEVLNYLREKTGRRFGKDENHLKFIKARLRDMSAPTLEDCKQVIDKKWTEWGNSDDMAKCINPTTLFRKANFYRYLDESKEIISVNDDSYEAYMRRKAERQKDEG